MSEHYSGNDPAKGCGLMIVGTLVVIFLILCLIVAESVVNGISVLLGHPLP